MAKPGFCQPLLEQRRLPSLGQMHRREHGRGPCLQVRVPDGPGNGGREVHLPTPNHAHPILIQCVLAEIRLIKE